MSGEVSGEAHEKFRVLMLEIEKQIKSLMNINDYGDAVSEIAIIPTIFSAEFLTALPYKERKRFSPKTKVGEFRLRIDYDKFVKANEDSKRRLIVQNIIDSIRILKTKVKKGFDGDKLEKDIRELFKIE